MAARHDNDPDGSRMLDDARQLAFPRYPGTAGNLRAKQLVAERLRETGLAVEEQEFRYDIRPAFRAIRAVLISGAVLVGLAAALSPWAPAAALVSLLLGAGVAGVMLVWAPGAERLYRGEGPTRTWNVWARRSPQRPRMTLILLAHYDSKSQNLSFPFRMGFTLLAILGGVVMLLLLTLRVAGAGSGAPWTPALAGAVAALALVALSTLKNGNASPGGVDNAGSVALLFELARRLPHRVPDDVELIFLSTGAEEDHMVGAMRWLDLAREGLGGRPVYALNFDGAGSPGRPVILESYGLGRRFAPQIARRAVEAAARLGLPLRRVWLPPAMGIDAIPFHHRGVPCLTFSSGSLGRATIAVHSAGDVAEHLDRPTLERVARLALDVAEGLCEQEQDASGSEPAAVGSAASDADQESQFSSSRIPTS